MQPYESLTRGKTKTITATTKIHTHTQKKQEIHMCQADTDCGRISLIKGNSTTSARAFLPAHNTTLAPLSFDLLLCAAACTLSVWCARSSTQKKAKDECPDHIALWHITGCSTACCRTSPVPLQHTFHCECTQIAFCVFSPTQPKSTHMYKSCQTLLGCLHPNS